MDTITTPQAIAESAVLDAKAVAKAKGVTLRTAQRHIQRFFSTRGGVRTILTQGQFDMIIGNWVKRRKGKKGGIAWMM